MNKSGYSLIEVFGVVALVLTLAVVAIPSIKSFTEGGKQGAAARNASALNSAVAQYDQSGGLITAKVTVPSNVASLPVNELPELKVLSLLREADGGSLVSAWQEPIFDDEGYRVVWRNDLPEDKKGVTSTLGGESNAAAEALIASGDGGRFELISPLEEAGRKGIIGFQQGGLLVAAIEPEGEPSPTPVPANRNPAVVLTASNPSPKVGDLVAYYANGTDPDGDSLTYAFAHVDGTEPAGSSSTFSRAYTSTGTFSVSVNVTDGKGGTAQASIPVTVGAAAADPSAGLTASPMDPHRGQVVTYTATGTDLNGEALTYRFIRDGSIVQEGASPTYSTSYSDLGPKLVTVVSINQSGLSKNADITVNVRNRAPSVSVGVNPLTGYRGQLVTFTATGADLDGDGMTYSFNGGAYGGNTFSTSYSTVGDYTATATAKDVTGVAPDTSAPASATVKIVNRMPSVTLVVDKPTGVRGDEFTFTATGSDPDNDAIAYSFKVGPTGTWSEYKEANEFMHTFAYVGDMEVFAKVRDSLGGESVESVPAKVTIVNRAPSVTMTSAKPSEYERVNLSFTATGADPDGDVLLYSFNGGAFGESNVFVTRFSTPGVQPVTVVAKDSFGALSTPFLLNVEILEANEFVFYWNQGVHTQDISRVLTSAGNASQHTNFDVVMAAINSVGADKVAAALAAGGATQNIVGSTRTAQSAEALSYSGGWVAGYSGGWAAHVGTHLEKFRMGYGRGARTAVRNVYTYHHYRHAYWHRTVTGTSTISEYQSRTFTGNSIVGVNTKTGQVVTIPASDWGNVMAGNIQIDGKAVNVAGYAGMTSEAEEFLTRQYNTSRQWNEHYATTLQHYHTSQTRSGHWFHPVTVSFTKGGDFPSGEWRKIEGRKPVESAKRSFNLDGEGARDWEWVGPTEGILVVNEAKDPMFQPNGTHFFGHNTWGQKWANATDPMKTLDKDSDGFLKGSELDTVWVWVDANTDAKVQEGELTTLPSKGITSISVNNQDDSKGGEWFPGGATGPAGAFDMVDWWSVR